VRGRKLLMTLAGPAVVVTAGAVVVWPRPSSRITQENCDREPATWVRPELVCEVRFTAWTGGHLRHPIFIGMRGGE
jgi:hypothetical protein